MSIEQLHGILAMGAENPPPTGGSPDDMRAWFSNMMEPTPTAAGIAVEDIEIAGQACEVLEPEGAPADKMIVYVHGGGWLFGTPRSHRVITSNIARSSGLKVVSAHYRLAPENPAPAAHDDVYAIFQWAAAQVGAKNVALIGDSAGGNMALSTAVRLRDNGEELPSALVLMSPALDLEGTGASHKEHADAPLVDAPTMAAFNGVYVGERDRSSPEFTAFHSDMSGLPDTLIHVGSWELLRSDSETIAERMKTAGTHVDLKIWDGMVHNHQLFAPFLEEGMASLEEIGGFVKSHL